MKSIFRPAELEVARAFRDLGSSNPFLPERIEHERRILADDYISGREVWSMDVATLRGHPNVQAIRDRSEALASALRPRLDGDHRVPDEDLELYEAVATYVLYERVEDDLFAQLHGPVPESGRGRRLPFWGRFQNDAALLLGPVRRRRPADDDAHMLGLFWQVRRAFNFIFIEIFGASMPAARLRAAACLLTPAPPPPSSGAEKTGVR